MIVLCAFAAILLHGTITVGEQILIKDKIYIELKTSENARLKKKELLEFIADYTEKHGIEPNPKHVAVVKNELEQKYRQFPIEIPLGIAIIAAFIAGFFLSRRRNGDEPSPVVWKDIALLSCFSVMAAALILILNRL